MQATEDVLEVPSLSQELATTEGDTVDHSQQQGTPVEERRRKYRTRRPTITETKCQYHSVRALISSIKDRTHP